MLFLSVLLAAACAVSVLAADISGKWVAQIPGRQGNTTETTFTFKVEGGKLTGSVGSPRGEQEITEGKVSGEDVSFVTVFSGGGGDFKISYKGKIAGNEIKFSRTFEGGGGGGGRGGAPVEFVAKRAN
jgi:hypothetical protein